MIKPDGNSARLILNQVLKELEEDDSWSEWSSLGALPDRKAIPAQGLYKVRLSGQEGLAYLGESGRLPGRLHSDLRVALREIPPLAAPHTAAPALWIMRMHHGAEIEVAFTSTVGLEVRERKGAEAAATFLYRLKERRSPAYCFHRMPAGWARSGQTRGTEAWLAGQEFSRPSLPPVTAGGDELSQGFGGLDWSPWKPLGPSGRGIPKGIGVYRLASEQAVLRIGEGTKIRSALQRHWRAVRSGSTPVGRILKEASGEVLLWSCVEADWDTSQREEIAFDLLGAIVLNRRSVPLAQWVTEHRGIPPIL
jgi:hypothetical protein